jgi:hypothetical protein
MDRADIGMIESRRCPRFRLKSFQGQRVAFKVRWQELQGHMPTEAEVFGLVDDAHSSPAQLLQDAVMRNGLANHGKGDKFDVRPRQMVASMRAILA